MVINARPQASNANSYHHYVRHLKRFNFFTQQFVFYPNQNKLSIRFGTNIIITSIFNKGAKYINSHYKGIMKSVPQLSELITSKMTAMDQQNLFSSENILLR